MRILWISSIAWKSDNTYSYPINGAGAVSGSLFQQTIIEELESQGHVVDIVADYPYAVGSNICRECNWSHSDNKDDIAIKTIDIPYISLLYKAKSIKKVVERKVKSNNYDIAIAYLIHQPYMNAIAYAKKLNPQIKTILICPDLPDMMDMSLKEKRLKSVLKKVDLKRVSKLYKAIDGFVLFADAMKEKIDIGNSLYTVIEGVATLDDLDITPVDKENFILYAGTLHKNIGIENIIKALEFIDDKTLKLKLYGTGELEDYIKKVAQENPRIIYGGFVDRQTLFNEQKKAVALVNARNNNDAYTRYSFPSKTFEYLYSGTPFVTTKLEGVPNEYSQFLFEIEDNKPESIADIINQIVSLDKIELAVYCERAREFVVNKKNKKIQTEKLVHFLNKLTS